MTKSSARISSTRFNSPDDNSIHEPLQNFVLGVMLLLLLLFLTVLLLLLLFLFFPELDLKHQKPFSDFSFNLQSQRHRYNSLNMRIMTAGHWCHSGLFHRRLLITIWPCENAMLQGTFFSGRHFEIRWFFVRWIRCMRFLLFNARRRPIDILH